MLWIALLTTYLFVRRVAGCRVDRSSLLRLLGNGPNPFHRATTITFTVPQAGAVELTVYNMLGQEVLARRAAYASPGQYSLDVEAAGLLSSSGIYLYRLVMGNEARVGTMVYLP